MLLSEIWIYPVKSLGGIRLSEAKTEERGLQYDRRWMIIDENDQFVTQRFCPKMALIDVALLENALKISNRLEPGNEVLVPFKPVSAKPATVTIWDDVVEAITVCDEADHWLSKELGLNLRLIAMPETTKRQVDPKYAKNNESVSFADAYPYLVISQASLDDLNTRLQEPVTMARFRPNFVITGTMPFEEDQWNRISIGSIDFEILKPCARCVLTTINPETAEKGAEPLKTMATYRRVNNKILFGQNMVARDFGLVKEGDLLEVWAKKG